MTKAVTLIIPTQSAPAGPHLGASPPNKFPILSILEPILEHQKTEIINQVKHYCLLFTVDCLLITVYWLLITDYWLLITDY